MAEEPRSQADIDTIAMLSVRVHPDLRKRLKRYSVESGKSMQEIVETAITRYIDAEESARGCSAPDRGSGRPPSGGRAACSTSERSRAISLPRK